MKNKIGIAGIIIALLAVGTAIFQDKLRQPSEHEKFSIMSKVLNKSGFISGSKRKSELPSYDAVNYSYISLGFLALIFGVVSYLKNENLRFSGMAGALGVIAIGWEYVLIGIVVGIIILILANLGTV